MTSSHKDQFSRSAYVRKVADQDLERRIRTQHEYRQATPARKNAPAGLRVAEVAPGSVAARLGIQPGEEILEVNGLPVIDAIDFQYQVASFGELTSIRTQARRVDFVRQEYENFGLEFEPIEPLVCDNDCVFCFVHQNRSDTRKSLRIKDEDYRLSFLFGNYLTLTNVGDEELDRIIRQHLSPLYISVHATEPELRTRMLGNTRYDGLDEKLDRLTAAGIQLHCQIVLCPGWNDGINLDRTISDLARRYPGVQSIAVVPVGLTDYRQNLPLIEPVTTDYARLTLRHVGSVQSRFLKEWDTPFVFLGDEFYILAGESIPPGEHYREFPQIENGVGMVRTFLDDFDEAVQRLDAKAVQKVHATVATGRLFHPYLEDCLRRTGLDLDVREVENRFWGAGINVAGLLTGSDFVTALRDRVHGDLVLIPSEAVIGAEGLFLDDMKLSDVERALGVPVVRAGYTASEFIGSVNGLV